MELDSSAFGVCNWSVVREGVGVVWCGRRYSCILDYFFEYFALQQEFIFDFEYVLFSFIFVLVL